MPYETIRYPKSLEEASPKWSTYGVSFIKLLFARPSAGELASLRRCFQLIWTVEETMYTLFSEVLENIHGEVEKKN